MKLSSTEQHCTKTGVKANSSWSKVSHTDYQKVGKAQFENIFNILQVGLFGLGSREHTEILWLRSSAVLTRSREIHNMFKILRNELNLYAKD